RRASTFRSTKYPGVERADLSTLGAFCLPGVPPTPFDQLRLTSFVMAPSIRGFGLRSWLRLSVSQGDALFRPVYDLTSIYLYDHIRSWNHRSRFSRNPIAGPSSACWCRRNGRLGRSSVGSGCRRPRCPSTSGSCAKPDSWNHGSRLNDGCTGFGPNLSRK